MNKENKFRLVLSTERKIKVVTVVVREQHCFRLSAQRQETIDVIPNFLITKIINHMFWLMTFKKSATRFTNFLLEFWKYVILRACLVFGCIYIA